MAGRGRGKSQKTVAPASTGEETAAKPYRRISETVLKKAKVRQHQRLLRFRRTEETKKEKPKRDRPPVFQRAEKLVLAHRRVARDGARLDYVAKRNDPVRVPANAKMLFVIRIRGAKDLSPKSRKLLQLFHLHQLNTGVFVKVTKPVTQMLRAIEPYVAFGAPSLKTVRDLVYKRGFGKVGHERVRLTDNAIVEKALGQSGLICLEDLVHEIVTVGGHFREATDFLWPFKLSKPPGGWNKKPKASPDSENDSSSRGNFIDELVAKIN
jgi:large subunit ribosomal protein L7e